MRIIVKYVSVVLIGDLDAITYLGDKVLRLEGGGKRSIMQSGFLFYENRHGFNFQSIDKLCSQGSR